MRSVEQTYKILQILVNFCEFETSNVYILQANCNAAMTLIQSCLAIFVKINLVTSQITSKNTYQKSKFTLSELIHKNFTGESVEPCFVGSEFPSEIKQSLYFEFEDKSGHLLLKDLSKDLENVAYSEQFARIGKKPGAFVNFVSNDAKYRILKRRE